MSADKPSSQSSAVAAKSKLKTKYMVFVLSLLLIVCCLLGAYVYIQQQLYTYRDTQQQVINVERGESFNQVLNRLADKGLVSSINLAKIYIKQQGLENKLKAGEYQLQPQENLLSLLDTLVSGKTVQYRLTLVEGWDIKQALKYLQQQPKLKSELKGLSLAQIQQRLNLQHYPGLEGLFLAETYHYHQGTSDVDILLQSHQMLRDYLLDAWDKKTLSLPYDNDYQALIMASIIEKETGLRHERTKISGVFVRRLQKNMRLQTDPTVIYGLGDAYQGNITRAHLRKKTPYNTYVISGLPPTPIALVGREAIDAALHPDMSNNALYFVAKGDGSHYFSETLTQHNKAVRQYQLKRRKNYRSTPE